MIRSVLVIDDDSDIRRIAQLSLEAVGGWRTWLAATGAEGIAIAAKEHPDVILLDVTMPDMTGIETLSRLLAAPESAAIPVIFMTARVQSHEIDRYLQSGAVGVIKKPFDAMALPGDVARIVSERATRP